MKVLAGLVCIIFAIALTRICFIGYRIYQYETFNDICGGKSKLELAMHGKLDYCLSIMKHIENGDPIARELGYGLSKK